MQDAKDWYELIGNLLITVKMIIDIKKVSECNK